MKVTYIKEYAWVGGPDEWCSWDSEVDSIGQLPSRPFYDPNGNRLQERIVKITREVVEVPND